MGENLSSQMLGLSQGYCLPCVLFVYFLLSSVFISICDLGWKSVSLVNTHNSFRGSIKFTLDFFHERISECIHTKTSSRYWKTINHQADY